VWRGTVGFADPPTNPMGETGRSREPEEPRPKRSVKPKGAPGRPSQAIGAERMAIATFRRDALRMGAYGPWYRAGRDTSNHGVDPQMGNDAACGALHIHTGGANPAPTPTKVG
jgi:hypothetical protein